MKVKTVFKSVPSQVKKLNKEEKFFRSLIIAIDMFSKTLIPFSLGVYFHQTQSLWFLVFIVLCLVFYPEFDYEKGTIKMTIKRLF